MGTRTNGLIVRALLLLAGAPALVAAQDLSGITFDMTTTAHGPIDSMVQRGKGWVAANQLRLDLRGASPMGLASGLPGQNFTLLLSRDSLQQDVVTMVDHDSKTFMSPGKMLEQMTALMGTLSAEMRPSISVETRNVRVDTLGAGETISGFATRRYKIAMQLVVKIDVMEEKQEFTMNVESDAMYSEELSEFGILRQWSRTYESLLGPMLGGDSAAVNQFRRMEAAFPRGVPLRSDDRIWTSVGEPGSRTVTTLTNIVRTGFPRSVFEVPPGYTETLIPSEPALN